VTEFPSNALIVVVDDDVFERMGACKSSPQLMPLSTTHFNYDRHLNRRDVFKHNRAVALAENVAADDRAEA
jgi:hypothetical protein